jgi:hypothetical protein
VFAGTNMVDLASLLNQSPQIAVTLNRVNIFLLRHHFVPSVFNFSCIYKGVIYSAKAQDGLPP